MKKLLIGAIAVTLSAPVLAWGEREQGVLAGIAGMWMYNQLNRAAQQPQVPQYHPPVYSNPQPQYAPPQVHGYPQPQAYTRQYCDVSYVSDRFGVTRQVTYCYQR